MKLGIVGYANNSGIGTMYQDLVRIFDIEAYLIIPGGDKGTDDNLVKGKVKHLRMADAWTPTDGELEWLFSRVDAVITVETDWNSGLFKKCKDAGIRSIFMPMGEWFDNERYAGASVYICTSHYTNSQVMFNNKINMTWPIDTDRFKFRLREGAPKIFVHNAGFGGMNYRKGTIETVQAFHKTDALCPDIKLLLRSQRELKFFPKEIRDIIEHDKRIEWISKDFVDNAEMYQEGDFYLYPARYDGQALVAEEAMACGLPIFVTDAEPMNEFSDDERFKIKCAVAVEKTGLRKDVNINICDTDDLARKIMWATTQDLTEVSRINRRIIEQEFSWKRWKDAYVNAFENRK